MMPLFRTNRERIDDTHTHTHDADGTHTHQISFSFSFFFRTRQWLEMAPSFWCFSLSNISGLFLLCGARGDRSQTVRSRPTPQLLAPRAALSSLRKASCWAACWAACWTSRRRMENSPLLRDRFRGTAQALDDTHSAVIVSKQRPGNTIGEHAREPSIDRF